MLLEPKVLDTIRQAQQKSIELLKSTPEHLQKEKFRRQFYASASQVNNFQLNIETEGYKVTCDQPLRNGGNAQGPCPVSMFIGAYAACLETNWVYIISLSDLAVDSVKVSIAGELDARFNIGGKNAPPAQLTQVIIKTIIKTTEEHSKFDRLQQMAIKTCPIGGSLREDIEKKYVLEFL